MRIKIEELRKGMIVWECENGENTQIIITKDAARRDNGWGAKGRSKHGNVDLFVADNAGAYGPKLYVEPQYG